MTTTADPRTDRAGRESSRSAHSGCPFASVVLWGLGTWTVLYWVLMPLDAGRFVLVAVYLTVVGAAAVWSWRSRSARILGSLATSLRQVLTLPGPEETVVLGVVAFVSLRDELMPRSSWAEESLALAVALGGLLLWLRTTPERADVARVVTWAAIGGAAVLALQNWWSFVAVALLICAGSLRDWHVQREPSPIGDEPTSSMGLALMGGYLALWVGLTQTPNADDAYYANKVLHYASSRFTWSSDDQMYGVADVPHVPFGNKFASFESAVGAAGSLSGIGPLTALYLVAAPLAAFGIPFAFRSLARSLHLRLPNVVGVMAAAGFAFFPQLVEFGNLSRIYQGKAVYYAVGVPLVLTAMLRESGDRSLRRRLETVVAVVACFGLTASAGLSLVPVTVAAAGALVLTDADPSLRQRIRNRAAPVVVATVISAVLFVVQRLDPRPPVRQVRFDDASHAFAWRFARRNRTFPDLDVEVVVVLACVLIAILLGSLLVRRYLALIVALLVIGPFNPWLFEPVFEPAGLTLLSWRVAFAIPLALAVPAALDAFWRDDSTRVLGVALAGAGLLLGASPYASFDQGSPEWDIPGDRETAELILENTPPGGRYLAPVAVEIAGTALDDDRYATAVRHIYLYDAWKNENTPPEFLGLPRRALSDAVGKEIERDVDWFREHLSRLGISTVCVTSTADVDLLRVIDEQYRRVGATDSCAVYTANPT